MGLWDRDYMRQRRNEDGSPVVVFPRWWLIAGGALVLLLVVATTSSHGPRSSPLRQSPPGGPTQVHPVVVNVNVASFTELRTLPRISESLAQAIIDGRPYSSADDLLRVDGIGPKTLQRIRPYVKVQ